MTLEERADDVLEWAFAELKSRGPDDTVEEKALLVNVGRSFLRWKCLRESYETSYLRLVGSEEVDQLAYEDLTDVEKRGYSAALSLDLSDEELKDKIHRWVESLEALRASA